MPTHQPHFRVTEGKASPPLWTVSIKVQRTDYTHRWSGQASSSSDASSKALDAARRAWPGFALTICSVVEVR